MKLNHLHSLVVVLLALASSSPVAAAEECKTARVRRSWTALSAADRELYKDAVAASMDSGAYIKFVEMHTEMMSEREAHAQCMFMYWHRAYLVAYENMLRGQHPRFACVTVPYWDWVTDYSKFATGQCSNMLECSPTMSFLGGRTRSTPVRSNVTINGKPSEGFCETVAPLNHFCQDSQSTGASCIQCVPREDWSNTTFPAAASFASVRAQIFDSNNIAELSVAIEEGAHNNIHGELGGAMGTHVSPADPIFWSHHANVDLLHSIFHKCKVGEQKMTFAQKIASPGWKSCVRRNSTTSFEPTDWVTMRTGFMGRDAVDATHDSLVGEYVASVPQQYAALMDIRDLGASSYTYELEGLLGSLYTECGATGATGAQQTQVQHASGGNGEKTSTARQSLPSDLASAPPTMTSLIKTTIEPAAQQMVTWINATDDTVLRRSGNVVLEAEKMACLFQDECLGGVTTYSPEFKKRFGITGEPRCKAIVDRIHGHAESVTVAEWKTQMVETFGCPTPTATTTAK